MEEGGGGVCVGLVVAARGLGRGGSRGADGDENIMAG